MHILTKQTVKVLVGASLPTCKGSGKAARAIERLVNLNVSSKFFTVVEGQRFHTICIGLRLFNNGPTDRVGCLVSHLDYDLEPTLALDHRHNGPLIVRSNVRVAFPLVHLFSSFDMRRPITQGVSVRDLAPSVPTARVALSLLLLAVKVPPHGAASSLVRVSMLVKRLMAERQFACNLLRAPLQFKQAGGLLSHPGQYCGWIPAFIRTPCRSCAGLLWTVTFKPPIARKISADGRFVSIQQLGDLSLIVSGFHKGVDLVSFKLAEIFLVHA